MSRKVEERVVCLGSEIRGRLCSGWVAICPCSQVAGEVCGSTGAGTCVFGKRLCHACVRHVALLCILWCTEKASVLSLFQWVCCSCSSSDVFLLRVGDSSFGSYSFWFHHFRAYGGRRLFLSSQSCAKKVNSFRATCRVFFAYFLEPFRVSTSVWSSL